MTENQAKKIFEKYNPADNVVRCPNGRAKMRKPLDTYVKAAVNLYGIIRRDEFAGIFNAQNEEQTNAMRLPLPVMLDTVLLPFKDNIIYDSFMASHSIGFGDGVKNMFEDEYAKSKDAYGIIMKL